MSLGTCHWGAHVFTHPHDARCACGRVVSQRNFQGENKSKSTAVPTPAGEVEDGDLLLVECEQLFERGERIIENQIAQIERMKMRLDTQVTRLRRFLDAVRSRQPPAQMKP